MDNLPLFTYGTLRTGQPLAHVLAPFEEWRENASSRGRFVPSNRPYPGVLFYNSILSYEMLRVPYVFGELVYLRPETYARALEVLDRTEGVALDPPLYIRRRIIAATPYDIVTAFAYEAGPGYSDAIY